VIPRIINADPTAFDPVAQPAVAGELVALQSGGGGANAGVVINRAGANFVQLLVGEVVVTLTITAPAALRQLVSVLVEDLQGNPLPLALVQVAATVNDPLTAVVVGSLGKVVSQVTSATGDLLAVLETGVTGVAEIDLTVAGAAAGDVYAIAQWPGIGKNSAALTFTP